MRISRRLVESFPDDPAQLSRSTCLFLACRTSQPCLALRGRDLNGNSSGTVTASPRQKRQRCPMTVRGLSSMSPLYRSAFQDLRVLVGERSLANRLVAPEQPENPSRRASLTPRAGGNILCRSAWPIPPRVENPPKLPGPGLSPDFKTP